MNSRYTHNTDESQIHGVKGTRHKGQFVYLAASMRSSTSIAVEIRLVVTLAGGGGWRKGLEGAFWGDGNMACLGGGHMGLSFNKTYPTVLA